MIGYKVLTHDFRSPIQGGNPIWDGSFGAVLPPIEVDSSASECGAGWNFCRDLPTALEIGGLWPDGYPSVAVRVEAIGPVIERGNKCRAAQLRLLDQLAEENIGQAIREISIAFAPHRDEMATSQIAWRHALAREHYEPSRIPLELAIALQKRGLSWDLKEFLSARDTWDAWAARGPRNTEDAQAIWNNWDAWEAWNGKAAFATWNNADTQAILNNWAAWAAWATRVTWAAWTAWEDAWAAKAARAALVLEFASLQGWVTVPRDCLTLGIQDAYLYGLGMAIPVGPEILGWTAIERKIP